MAITRRALLAAVPLPLVGCTPGRTPERWQALPPAESGSLFGTITADTRVRSFSRYSLVFANLETKETATVHLHASMLIGSEGEAAEAELNVPGASVGRLFEIRVPPGRFALAGVGFFQSSPSPAVPTRQLGGPVEAAPPVTVAVGETHYVGEYRGFPVLGAAMVIGRPLISGYFEIRDSLVRDRHLIAAVRGGEEPRPLVNSTPAPGSVTSRYIAA